MKTDVKCWLCGREVGPRGAASLTPFADIPIHRECLEDDRHAVGAPVAEPNDVVYLSASLFKT